MVLWHSDLRVSWRSQWVSLLLHGAVAVIILLLPWPLRYLPVWMLLLSLVVFDCVRSQRRINAFQGEVSLTADYQLRWQGIDWEICATPWMLRSGMMMRLRHPKTTRSHHVWLASDSMTPAEWRDLRRLLLQQPVRGSR